MANTKTIGELALANPLEDGDCLPISQPNATNPITQKKGDTRQVTVKQLFDYFDVKYAASRIPGVKQMLGYQPTPYELARWRLLPLHYQIIEIALYQDLCDRMWVGAANNASANFWYKCNADGTRNANGLWMRVEDGRGMFYRGAGANAVFKAANDTPYDGGVIGKYIGDAIRNLECITSYSVLRSGNQWSTKPPALLGFTEGTLANVLGGEGYWSSQILFNAANAVPTAHENRPASISVYPVISY